MPACNLCGVDVSDSAAFCEHYQTPTGLVECRGHLCGGCESFYTPVVY